MSALHAASSEPLRTRAVIETWWPLAASWLLMGLELPLVSAVMARLPQPTLGLAAYGGVVMPLAMLIEAPIIMLLAASTALSRDWPSYALVRRFMLVSGSALTALHTLLAFTPLYERVVRDLLGAPVEILEPGRIGLQIMTPWTISIAYRRFQQGVLIRFGHSRAVGIGTAVRLLSNAAVLAAGYAIGTVPGIVIGTLAIAVGVVSEAVFIGLCVHPVLERTLKPAPVAQPLDWRRFARFYTPLAVTPILMFLTMPLASAAMSRMPGAIESLAVWPVIGGLLFALRSVGFALNEVVVALLERPRPLPALRRFARGLATVTSLVLVAIAATPLSGLWFGTVSALPPHLVTLAGTGLWIALLMPALSALHSLYQGTLVHSHQTRGVPESVALQLLATAGVLAVGVATGQVTGLFVALAALVAGGLAQLGWLWIRARAPLAAIASREAQGHPTAALEAQTG